MDTAPTSEWSNADEIKTNRSGAISSTQRKFIVTATDFKAWAIAAVALALLSVISIYCLTEMGSGSAGSILGIVLGGCLLFCLWRGLRMWNLRRRLISSEVISTPGEVVYHYKNPLDPMQYIVKDSSGKRINPAGLGGVGVVALRPGPYNIYYLPIQNWLLSIEPTATEAEYNYNLLQLLAETKLIPGLKYRLYYKGDKLKAIEPVG